MNFAASFWIIYYFALCPVENRENESFATTLSARKKREEIDNKDAISETGQEINSPIIIEENFKEKMRNCMEDSVKEYWNKDFERNVTTLRAKRQIEDIQQWLPGIIETQYSVEKRLIIRCHPPNSALQPSTNFRWLKNGEVIWDVKNPVKKPTNVQPAADRTLHVMDEPDSDFNSTSYSCQFLNTFQSISSPVADSTASVSAAISSTVKELIIRKIPENGKLETELMQEVTLQCIPRNLPKISVQWYFNNKPLNSSSAKSRSLKFNVTNKSFAGEYKCVVSNVCIENEDSETFDVNVLYKPEITAEKSLIHTALGEKTELSCIIHSYPPAKVNWLRGEVLLNSSVKIYPRVFNEKHTLIIKDVSINDFGSYTCQATNFLGRTAHTVLLSGICNKAKFKTEKERRSHTAYTLIWEVDCYTPVIQYRLLFRKYKKKSTVNKWIPLTIPSSDNTGPIHTELYTLTGLEPSTVYEATVSSRNYFGWSESSTVHRFATEDADVIDEPSETTVPRLETSSQSAASIFSDSEYVTNEIESALEQKGQAAIISRVFPQLLITGLIFTVIIVPAMN